MSVSQLARSIKTSPTLKLNQTAAKLREKGEPVIHLGGGELKSNSPLDAVLNCATQLNTGEIRYAPADGLPALKKAVLRYTEEHYGQMLAPQNVIVSSGAKQSIMTFLYAVLEPKDEVVYPAPYWVSYPEMVKLAGGVPVAVVPEDGPEDLHLAEDKTALLLAGKIGHYSLEKRFLRKDGEIVWVNITVSPLWKPGQTPIRNMIVVEDITEHKMAEEEKRSLEERLQRAEKMEAIGTLAGGVAHDLNNMLGVLIGNAEILIDDLKKTDPLHKLAEEIMSSGERAAAEVQNLLTMARRGVILREPANLNRIVAGLLKTPEIRKMLSAHPHVVPVSPWRCGGRLATNKNPTSLQSRWDSVWRLTLLRVRESSIVPSPFASHPNPPEEISPVVRGGGPLDLPFPHLKPRTTAMCCGESRNACHYERRRNDSDEKLRNCRDKQPKGNEQKPWEIR